MNRVQRVKLPILESIGMWTSSIRKRAIIAGYRSGLEEDVQKQLKKAKVKNEYESIRITYVIPSSSHVYTPDFLLWNGIVIETKGRWVLEDRRKLALIKEQYPNLDLRMVFNRSKSKIRKGSKTTYADICKKLGIPFADKWIPEEWMKEKRNLKSIKIIEKMRCNNGKK